MAFAGQPGWGAAGSAPWTSERAEGGRCGRRRPGRALEIVGVIFTFIYFWPAALAYLVWKCAGYPMSAEMRRLWENGLQNSFRDMRFSTSAFSGSGNLAFDEYRRAEIERLEAERRRLDEEARDFRGFVEELKRAKDREEFDAYMAKRRAAGGTTSV